ncbi:aldo/keto reductase [Sinomonas halotolerans]|uniref:Aldo/keto reductase n=1 Tax=Sinomonas halotolerans TaxID=1644133 RepID=A0ABU9X3E9_9MICC
METQTSPVAPRTIAGRELGPVGFGWMNLNQAYGPLPSREDAAKLLLHALDSGVTHFDTATIYGATANETLIGETLSGRRDEFFLASKGGMHSQDGRRVIDGRPEALRAYVDASLARLRTDHIDLYYLHRWDRNVPIEECVGTLGELVREGKIGGVGLSEISAATLRRAHAAHPVAALQNEYSLWTRNPELGTLEACRELGIAFVAFSPVGRGALGGVLRDPAGLPDWDFRRTVPRFDADHWPANLALLDRFGELAHDAGCTPAQLAIAWVLSRGEHVIALPGTRSAAHLDDDFAAGSLEVPADVLARAGELINERTVSGGRYSPAAQADVDTEEFPA